jgi:hypothetical protein
MTTDKLYDTPLKVFGAWEEEDWDEKLWRPPEKCWLCSGTKMRRYVFMKIPKFTLTCQECGGQVKVEEINSIVWTEWKRPENARTESVERKASVILVSYVIKRAVHTQFLLITDLSFDDLVFQVLDAY